MGNMISESDTRANFIDPKLANSQWEPIHIVREYYFTDGRKLLGNKRGKQLYLDYLLKFNNTNLAIVEAKKLGDHPTKGFQKAYLIYAERSRSISRHHFFFKKCIVKSMPSKKIPACAGICSRTCFSLNSCEQRIITQSVRHALSFCLRSVSK